MGYGKKNSKVILEFVFSLVMFAIKIGCIVLLMVWIMLFTLQQLR